MTTAPAVDTVEHASTIKALVSTALGLWDCYDYGTVPGAKNVEGEQNPGTEPRQYALITVGRRFVGARRAASAGRSGWRVTIRSVGRTPNEVRWLQNAITGALDEVVLTIDGRVSTRLQFESGQEPEPDDGAYSALDTWTYSL